MAKFKKKSFKKISISKPAKLKPASFRSKMKPKKSNPTGKWKVKALGGL